MGKLKTIYSDGGCYKGIGSWAFLEIDGMGEIDSEVLYKLAGLTLETTNNRMEMMAIIEAIDRQPYASKLRIYSDSGYVVTGFTHPSYLKKWLHNGWKTSKNDPVENQDLWEEIIKLDRLHDIQFILIRGHGKNPSAIHNHFNNIVDRMCTEMRNKYNEHVRKVNELIPSTNQSVI